MNKTMLALLVLVVAAAAFVGVGAYIKFDGQAPAYQFDPDPPEVLGSKTQFTLKLSDRGEGLKSFRLELIQGDASKILAQEAWPGRYLLLGSARAGAEAAVEISPQALGLKDGPATLKLVVRDWSWRESFHGNKAEVTRQLTIDTRPPLLSVLSGINYLDSGGCGLVIYRADEEVNSGVMVDDLFYRGVPFGRAGSYQCLFGLPYDVDKEARLSIRATDRAGNRTEILFKHRIKPRRWRHSKINITESFLKEKMPEFRRHYPDLPPDDLAGFLKINQELRRQNNQTIAQLTAASTPQQLWQGAFVALPNAARTAGFADQRTYFFEGQEVDRQYHMGLDLASTAQAAVPAANKGRVVWAGYLGIYGQSVILDHGQGLYSLYGHLSSLAVAKGHVVDKDHVLGQTGSTGLAGGDHLHFAVICQGTYVNPLEWLDPRWIKDNIIAQLEAAEEGG